MELKLPMNSKNYSLLTFTLPENYSYCVFVAVGSMIFMEWQKRKVSVMHWPSSMLFATQEAVEKSEQDSRLAEFYQNLMVDYPQFLGLLLLGGLDGPILTATGGVIYMVGQALLPGQNGDSPRRTICNVITAGGWLAMLVSTIKLALRLLRII